MKKPALCRFFVGFISHRVLFCGKNRLWGPHHDFDVALSRSKHRTVGGGLPAMNDDAIFLIHRVDCIAGKPPLIKQPITY